MPDFATFFLGALFVAAEPDVAHPIAERKLAETYLFDLVQGRKTREMIDRELNGKGEQP